MLPHFKKLLLLCFVALTPLMQGCGQKGALFLPEKSAEELIQQSFTYNP